MANARVRLTALVGAINDSATDVVYYVDSHNGDVSKISRGAPLADLARFKTMSDKDPDRFLKVPKPTGEESYGDMAEFTRTVKDRKLQERLQIAVRGGGTMRNFLDALTPSPMEKERWYKFRESRVHARARDWVRQNGLEPV
ncbi:MAG: hypothetical protein FJX76_11675 [Armatimonadetes bacterium]|nr:hypothetical protein [Armatimonadota bacterium]